MTEDEYVAATDLARVRAIIRLLQDMHPDSLGQSKIYDLALRLERNLDSLVRITGSEEFPDLYDPSCEQYR